MKSTVCIVFVAVFALFAIADAHHGHHGKKHHSFTPKVYEVTVDPKDTVMDNSTCAKRCDKEDMNIKAKVFRCTAFYTGMATNKCFLFVLHCQKKGAFKKPTDLVECVDCLYKTAKRSWRKGGKSSWRNKSKRGKQGAKKAQEYSGGP